MPNHAAFRSLAQRLAVPVTALALLLAAGASDALPSVSSAYGPSDGYAGEPPNGLTCTLCHDTYDLNSGDGALQLLDLPPAFAAGETYPLRVRIEDPGMAVWGFELTVVGPAGQMAGVLNVTDPVRTQLSDDPGMTLDYLKHTYPGTDENTPNGPVTWNFSWTAPDLYGVTFYLAGVAGNVSEDPGGDYVYTLQAAVPQGTVAATPASWSAIKALYAAP